MNIKSGGIGVYRIRSFSENVKFVLFLLIVRTISNTPKIVRIKATKVVVYLHQ